MGSRRDKMVRLVQAAAIAAKSYQVMRDAVLRGEVRGYQDPAGRWWVREDDAQRLAQQRDSVSVST